ncbi:hypothetical protein CC1G_12915 [Coprinopsis cinerea okayama7|uniref:F-box domain-containing protein n=1 Tax=Coprinopsis cinerea (strain Okayama-7 / 130 / ATCC MYA-4618 / FGSC 9003) TaxID=240176 RepID=A8P9M0_COPC7|nr:hypothetical protein CC1G_12915 [Coprinopsis cinerea okayama7\|eukprot:XP_001839798.1 hypothetical protein CC1G_12915 [Coprinopsis cinerea okayama7\
MSPVHHKFHRTTLQTMARELVDMVVENVWDANDVSHTAALASTCHYLAAVCQPLLFTDIVIRQREGGGHLRTDVQHKIRFLMDLFRADSHLCGSMKTLALWSDLNDSKWMTTPSAVALLGTMAQKATLVAITVGGKGPEKLDGSQLHRTTLRQLPSTLEKFTLVNVAKASTNIFTRIRMARNVSILGVSFPGSPPTLPGRTTQSMATRNRVYPVCFNFDLRPELKEEGMATACRVVRKWVSFDRVEKVSIHTGDEEEWMMLNSILKEGGGTLRCLEVDVTGLGRAGDSSYKPSRLQETEPSVSP